MLHGFLNNFVHMYNYSYMRLKQFIDSKAQLLSICGFKVIISEFYTTSVAFDFHKDAIYLWPFIFILVENLFHSKIFSKFICTCTVILFSFLKTFPNS